MNKIMILDCTLRDGGYINGWNFGEETIKKVIHKLTESKIDIIECGFLDEEGVDYNKSLFNSVERMREFIEPKEHHIMYVGMIAQPYIPIELISECDGNSIDGIRLTFHEDEIDEALVYGKQLIDKGYKVFIQPVGTTSYSDASLLDLIQRVNQLNPYAFYLVDTLGIMYKNDLLRMFHLLDHNLHDSISIGFHSHNNLQLSFSNAQELLTLPTKRNIIIDSSVFGMGRGAGNLCTELITQYINENIETRYETIPLLQIIDEHLNRISLEAKWGYSIPYFLAAIYRCHPNYAYHLINKQTLSVKSISAILSMIPRIKRDMYDKEHLEELYINYQSNLIDDFHTLEELREMVQNRDLLVLAPGKSIENEKEEVQAFIRNENPYVISVNFIPQFFCVDAVFISNSKRFEKVEDTFHQKNEAMSCITTSNITVSNKYTTLQVNYSDLLNENPMIADNAALMLLKLLRRLSVKSVYFAGFDGFTINQSTNYFTPNLNTNAKPEDLVKINDAIRQYLSFMEKKMEIQFITSTVYRDTVKEKVMKP
ncbi:aldolase catalytic domain-containing protein [Robertmurraya kyonggiensis]|uniref:4-hydroxy-2-ketovalerate aldolase n=1 Tax=Robertmurraya kyonggiensis TaxID=1037680 RepID=A0A4U1D0G7_9BACI|nr:aldolase catalytic domain-containing protein [Robertmurraya kyonggiensis]TKC15504.1 4-hydroxy-2-ketovalerate aldolase [Robertmurraya kyonggiensis]